MLRFLVPLRILEYLAWKIVLDAKDSARSSSGNTGEIGVVALGTRRQGISMMI